VKKLMIYLAITLSLVGLALFLTVYMQKFQRVTVDPPPPAAPRLTVVLLPLDSRPPCTQFVEQLAKIDDIRVIMPPAELLDHYKTPANKIALRSWLKKAVIGADAAIISSDMLIHGGLLASRLASGSGEDIDATLALLPEIHRQHPQVKLYGFTIIPRSLIADNSQNALYQKKMLQYSILKDEILTFENPVDVKRLSQLEHEVPCEIITHYVALNEQTVTVNKRLVNFVEQGILSGLVIGQDDGQPFGMPNIAKKRLIQYVSKYPDLSNKVFITRGTDEVALTILGFIDTLSTYHPRICVKYSHPDAPSIIMPFMPHSVAKTVQEKISMVGGVSTPTVENADFILYIHIGTRFSNHPALLAAANEVAEMLRAGDRVALVDLSEDFTGQETLLPCLLEMGVPVNRLSAYAGWNTTSNSIGTAVTQGTLFTLSLRHGNSFSHVLRTYKYNLEFLTSRLLDDWYYEKDVQPIIKNDLIAWHIDPNNLGGNYNQVNNLVECLMEERAYSLGRQTLENRPLFIKTDRGVKELSIEDIQIKSGLPWSRIFEIRVSPVVSLSVKDSTQ